MEFSDDFFRLWAPSNSEKNAKKGYTLIVLLASLGGTVKFRKKNDKKGYTLIVLLA